MFAVFGLLDAVNIKIKGSQQVGDENYLGVIYEAETRPNDQSAAKIVKIKANHEPGKDHLAVTSLLFWDIKTKYLPLDLFVHFPNVKKLHVMKPLQEMESPVNGHFMNAKNLLQVFITNQKIRKLGSRVFEGANNIEWIYLEHNKIDLVDEASFKELRTLKRLSLQSNLIKSLAIHTFEPLLDLEWINLNNNLITKLPPSLFANNKKIKSIMLDVNRLLYIQSILLPAKYDIIQLSENLCISETFFNNDDLDKVVNKACTIKKSPSEVFEAFKEQIKKSAHCDSTDKDQILHLKDQIKVLDGEIKQLTEDKAKLEDVLKLVKNVNVCITYNDSDDEL